MEKIQWGSWNYLAKAEGIIWWWILKNGLLLPINTCIHLPVEKAMAPHSGTFSWKIPWMEEPGRLQSMGSLRVGHD